MSRLALAFLLAFASLAVADESEKTSVELTGVVGPRGLPMAECDLDVQRIKLDLSVDKKGEGTGTLILDSTPNLIDELGFPIVKKSEPLTKLECTIKLVKTKKVLAEGAPAAEVEWQLFEITGPKIVSKLSLAREIRAEWSSVRFLWATKEGTNRTAVTLYGPPQRIQQQFPPCHPGCFPAGTQILTEKGAKAIEDIRAGQMISTIGADGKPMKTKVESMFVTKNRIVEVNIEGKTLITTATQPLALADGKLRAAGELAAGDRIQTWVKGERAIAVVKSVEPTLREVPVYNIVFSEQQLFVANGFVARSKPPAPVVP